MGYIDREWTDGQMDTNIYAYAWVGAQGQKKTSSSRVNDDSLCLGFSNPLVLSLSLSFT